MPTPADTGTMAEEEVTPLPQRRPAEVTTFITSLVAVAAALGFNLSTEAVIAVFVLIGTLPAIVTYGVGVYRDAVRALGD